MSSWTLILLRPIPTSNPHLKSLRPTRFSSPRSIFSSGFIPGKPVCCPNRGRRRSMVDSVRNPASGAGSEDLSIEAFEQESFINGSPKFSAGGLESTLNTLSKWLVTALFGIVLLWRHDAEALWAAMGSVLNIGLSTTLKKILNQERPVSALRSGPGMPSSHAQSIFYITAFTVLSMVERFGLNGTTATLSVLVFALGSYFSWLRVSQQLHTISQVTVGAALGSTFSILWFWAWNAFILEAFISSLWVRFVVVLGAAGFSVGFVLYIIRYWVLDAH